MSQDSPLGRVLGLGAARDGVGHWWAQRVTAVALVPLLLWLVVSIIALPDLAYDSATAWVAEPWHAVLLLILVPVLSYHSYLGVTVVIEDYVHDAGVKVLSLLVVAFGYLLATVAALFGVLRLAFGGVP